MVDTLDQRTDDYHPKDALGHAVKAIAITGGAGAFVSTVQNTLTKQNVGAWGVFTRTGSTIGIFGKKPRRHEIGRKDSADCSRSCYGWSIHVHQGRCRKPQKEGRLIQQRDRRRLRGLNARP
jgi:hypothetical protein